MEIDEAESWELLGSHGVGRVAPAGEDGPVVLPLNFQVVDGAVMFSTAEHSTLARADGTEIAFEAVGGGGA